MHAPVRLGDRLLTAAKLHRTGTHRARDPAATLAAFAPLMPRLGITRLANLTGLDVIGVPVFAAIRPNARSLATSQGKGLDVASARVSALMESIELWHAEHLHEVRLAWDVYSSLRRRAAVVDLDRLVHRAGRSSLRTSPQPWIEGWDLLQARPTWVPIELVALDLTAPAPGFGGPLFGGTNGLASGNHLLEAIAHALCEVIERHATARGERGPDARPVDLEAVDDPGCRDVLARIAAAGARCFAWDVTSSLGVPVYLACVAEPPSPGRRRALGAYAGGGCHLDPAIALARAITEAVQSRLTFISGGRDDCLRPHYWRVGDETTHASLWAELHAGAAAPTSLRAHSSRAQDSFEGDVHALLSALQAGGCASAVVVDLSHAGVGVPVVKVVVPGLLDEVET